MIRGPQSSGFMIGKKWLINAARANACPNETAVGRPMKTSKESIVGFVETSMTASIRFVDAVEISVVSLEARILSQSNGKLSRRAVMRV